MVQVSDEPGLRGVANDATAKLQAAIDSLGQAAALGKTTARVWAASGCGPRHDHHPVPLFGAVIGVLLGLLGGGGSILAVPVLVYALGLDSSQAIPISLIVIAVASVLGAAPQSAGQSGAVAAGRDLRRRRHPRHLRRDRSRQAPSAAGDHARVRRGDGRSPGYGCCATTVTPAPPARSATKASTGDDAHPGPSPPAFAVGLLTGLFGVGGGFLIIPALVLMLGVEMPIAVGTSLLIITANSAAPALPPAQRAHRLGHHHRLRRHRHRRITHRRAPRQQGRHRPTPALVRLPGLRRRRLRPDRHPAPPLTPTPLISHSPPEHRRRK